MVEKTGGDPAQVQRHPGVWAFRAAGFAAAGALFAAAWILELRLIVIAVFALAIVMTKAWFVRTNRDLPVVVGLDAVASASLDGSWTGELDPASPHARSPASLSTDPECSGELGASSPTPTSPPRSSSAPSSSSTKPSSSPQLIDDGEDAHTDPRGHAAG